MTQRIVNQRVAPVPLETRAAAAAWGEDGRVTIWCSNQGAQMAKMGIASWLGLDPALVHLITPAVGGGFGAKIGADPEFALVAHVAKLVGRPVRWAENRSENMLGMLHGRGQDQVVTIGGRRDGTVEAYSLVIDQDCRRLPPVRGRAADADHADGRRGVRLPEGARPGPRAGHQHDVHRCLPRGRPPRGDRGGRARHRPVRRRDRDGPGRGAPDQPDPAVRLPAHDLDGRDVRHRRLRRGPGQGAGGRRLRRAACRAGAPAGGRRRPAARHRGVGLRGDHRRRTARVAARRRTPVSRSIPTAPRPS